MRILRLTMKDFRGFEDASLDLDRPLTVLFGVNGSGKSSVLMRTFPNCQFIVTTHSPQVLSEVPNDAVVLVDNFQFRSPGAPTAGRDSNAILAEAMGTPERPAAQLEAIRAISTLLDEGKFADARVKLDALAQELTERDREVVGLCTMLHFLEGDDEAHPQGG